MAEPFNGKQKMTSSCGETGVDAVYHSTRVPIAFLISHSQIHSQMVVVERILTSQLVEQPTK
jgi:hypothetical protein